MEGDEEVEGGIRRSRVTLSTFATRIESMSAVWPYISSLRAIYPVSYSVVSSINVNSQWMVHVETVAVVEEMECQITAFSSSDAL